MLITNRNRNKKGYFFNSLSYREQRLYSIDELLLNEETRKKINPAIDNEKVRYIYQDIETVKLSFFKNSTDQLTFYDLGFTNNDIRNFKNVFTKSLVRINYFNNLLYNKNLLYQIDLSLQLGEDQIDENRDLLDVEIMPVNLVLEQNNLGFGMLFFKKPFFQSLPMNVYSKYYFLSAIDGSYDEYVSSFNTLNVENLNNYNTIKHEIYSQDNRHYMNIDQTNREILVNDGQLEIKLIKLTTN